MAIGDGGSWFVYQRDSNSHLAETVYLFARRKRPVGDEWTSYDQKGNAVRDVLGRARLLAEGGRPVQINIQGGAA